MHPNFQLFLSLIKSEIPTIEDYMSFRYHPNYLTVILNSCLENDYELLKYEYLLHKSLEIIEQCSCILNANIIRIKSLGTLILYLGNESNIYQLHDVLTNKKYQYSKSVFQESFYYKNTNYGNK